MRRWKWGRDYNYGFFPPRWYNIGEWWWGDDLLASGRVDGAALAQGDLAVVTSARGGGAVGHAGAGELLLDGLVDAGFGS